MRRLKDFSLKEKDFTQLFKTLSKEAPTRKEVDDYLSDIGFKDFNRAYQFLEYLTTQDTASLKVMEEIFPSLLSELNRSIEPDNALFFFTEFLNNYPDPLRLLWHFKDKINHMSIIITLFSTSPYLSSLLIKNPLFYDELFIDEKLFQTYTRKSQRQQLNDILEARKNKDFRSLLLYYKNFEYVRLGIRNIMGMCGYREFSNELSNTAEFILLKSSEHLFNQLVQIKSKPKNDYAYIFLGKLSSKMMHFGSDLDMIFVIDTREDQPVDHETNQFYVTFLSELTNFLKGTNLENFLYDIDLRLRPSGKSAQIIVSLNALKKYFRNKADIWERMVYLRSRIYAKNSDLTKRLRSLINDFVFSPVEDEVLLKEIRKMRRRIIDNLPLRKEMIPVNFFIKKGRGGLMDIEFISIYLSLLHSTVDKPIKHFSILGLLNKLYHDQILSSQRYIILRDRYIYLLWVQNGLRIVFGLKQKSLPREWEGRNRLALFLGYSGEEEFMDKYNLFTSQVYQVFDEVFYGS